MILKNLKVVFIDKCLPIHYIAHTMNNVFTQLPEGDSILPRYDLREPAFRRYEPFIARALVNGRLLVNPIAEFDLKPSTFKARFRDAVRAYRLYKYKSTQIPANVPYDLSVNETANGLILIVNELAELIISPVISRDVILDTCKQLAARTLPGPVYFDVPDEADRKWLMDLADPMSMSFLDIALAWQGNRVKIL